MSANSRAYVAEAMGTFTLCFIGGGAICLNATQPDGGSGLLGVAVAHGLALSLAVSAAMGVSGGHINPAVTLAILATGRTTVKKAVLYIISQLIGGGIGGLALLAVFGRLITTDTALLSECALGTPTFNTGTIGAGGTVFVELILTFFLLFAVFGTAVDPRAPKVGGFGIGLTLTALILVGGPLTGAALNPARTFGTGIVAALSGHHDAFWSQQWVYWIGPLLGGLVSGIIYDRLIMEKKV
jgi:MIP family channel proteins